MTTAGSSTQLEESLGTHEERGFLQRIRTASEVLRFRSRAIDAVLADEGASAAGVAIVALAGVASATASGAGVGGHLLSIGAHLLVSLVLAAVVHLGAALLAGGRGNFIAFYRPVSYTYLALWITGIPIVHAFFAWALWLWQLAVIVFVAERYYKLERLHAVALVGVPVAIGLFVLLLLNGLLTIAALLGWIL